MPILDPVTNFAKTTVPAGITNAATAFNVATGDGAKFPNPATLGHYNVTIYNSTDFSDPADDPSHEIMRVTARATDGFTVARAQEGTSAVAHNTGGKTYTLVLSLTKKMMDDIETALGTGGATVNISFEQTAHGFTGDEMVKSSGTDGEFDLAQADVPANADSIGMVTDVIDVDNFIITTEGFAVMNTLPMGAVAGDALFLDDAVAGGVTLTAPTGGTTVSKPIGIVLDASTGLIYIHNYRGQNNQDVSAGTGLYTVNADESVYTWLTTVIPAPRFGTNPSWTGTWGVPGSGNGDWNTVGGQNHGGNISGDIATTFFYPVSGKQIRFKWGMKGDQVNAATDYIISIGVYSLKFYGWTNADTVMHFIDNTAVTDTALAAKYLDAYHTYELVVDSTNTKLYIDGALVYTGTNSPIATSPAGAFSISFDQNPGGGGSADIRMFSEIIVSREV